MKLLYFAYGSNLKWSRMRRRVPRARRAGVASLSDHQLVCNKRGRDGSGKANLIDHPGRVVWGALYELWREDLAVLDGFEGGYDRLEVDVQRRDEGAARAVTYRSTRLIDDARPFDWYRNLILEGAREHALPRAYLTRLEALPWRNDPCRGAGRA